MRECVRPSSQFGDFNPAQYPQRQMIRAVYRQIARFLNWINRTGPGASGPSAVQATREAGDARRDMEIRSGSKWGDGWSP